MASNKEVNSENIGKRNPEERKTVNRMRRLVSDSDLSRLAPKLGREWRSFLRSELEIFHHDIEHIESDTNLTVTEKIFRLLKLWKSKRKTKATIHCLIGHLEKFDYGLETYLFLTERQTTENEEDDEEGREIHRSSSTMETPYDIANDVTGVSNKVVPRYWFVVEVIEKTEVQGFEETLTFEKGTKLDIIDKLTGSTSYLARDKDGHVFHILKKACSRLPIHSPVLWENDWFHEEISRGQLDDIFRETDVGTFVIRNSSEVGHFAISVKAYRNVLNFKINCTHTGYQMNNNMFYSLTDLISAYSGIPIYSTQEGKLYLRNALPK
ncbi:uncharacterized protein [Apostichopus japonicus]|uniref:uncharacterized protein n=1 Tax=Stichopus japonicus TaxID=307972 RepID=UPI003AB65366